MKIKENVVPFSTQPQRREFFCKALLLARVFGFAGHLVSINPRPIASGQVKPNLFRKKMSR
ncbi:hypothetical protein QTN47_25805 [Danxiaibacter flavus]|uniref:Uncharacterized protein n=1 Tax=Danxiaibacter flavus TaxID=3049108 RepID=A0ABV3ZN01_9BACT|nr:hypothetical protein QNM32_25805 [Chitinophagaceae bacterium DXS]